MKKNINSSSSIRKTGTTENMSEISCPKRSIVEEAEVAEAVAAYCWLISLTFGYYGRTKMSTVVVKPSVGVQDKLPRHENSCFIYER